MQRLTTEQIIENDHNEFMRIKRRVLTYAILWTAIVGFTMGYVVGLFTAK